LNLHIPKTAALQAVGLADAQPTQVFKWRRRESNPQSRRFELRRFAFFAYRAVIFTSALDGIWTPGTDRRLVAPA
jgi:hypothetical protein